VDTYVKFLKTLPWMTNEIVCEIMGKLKWVVYKQKESVETINKRLSNGKLKKHKEVKKKIRTKVKPMKKEKYIKDERTTRTKTKSNKKYNHSDNSHIKIFDDFWWDVKECQKCWWTMGWLQIHHIDKIHKDNHPFNLIKLCLVCHCKVHKGDKVYNLMKSRLNFILNK